MINEMIDKLNPMQKQAVLTTDGPLLLLAGAGSGKTRVLTHRIAYIIETGRAKPSNILAITFTNKAAREMKERVSALCEEGKNVWVSTFHSTCVRILRSNIDKLGYTNQFTIFDSDDSERLMKNIYKELNINDKVYPVKAVMNVISKQKDALVAPREYMIQVEKDFRMKKVGELYEIYQQRLKDNNALDFDDLIFKTVMLFRGFPDVLEKYRQRFHYIMVDEYQDTNASQYQLIKLLAGGHGNLCAVGDDDQSIYGWRGADIRNILNFEDDFKNTTVIKLEQNYRSSENILNSANAVIRHNNARKAKSLWTEQDGGEKITVYRASGDKEEAMFIAKTVIDGHDAGKPYGDFAVLYRNNAISRTIEEALVKAGIPYRLLGGTRFYDRKEIKDMLAYLRFIANPNDTISLSRIINVPKRGIGDSTVAKLLAYCAETGTPLMTALSMPEMIPDIKSKSKSLYDFYTFINEFTAPEKQENAAELLNEIVIKSGYRAELVAENTEESLGRADNIDELISKAAEFTQSASGQTGLAGFLEEVTLVADVDGLEEGEEAVVLMTLHSSKGLEFDTVFIAAFENGIFPGYRAMQSETPAAMEEERRLCYVGITRAKRKLYITLSKERMQFGQTQYNSPSDFLKELPKELLDIVDPSKSKARQTSIEPPRPSRQAYVGQTRFTTKPYSMPAPQNTDVVFEVGDKVKHLKFGIGTVKDVTPAGADYELTIEFPNATKKLFAKLAKLKKV
ncbi:MAG: DNA helicase PcrA [Firmicutes bacterium]|nr:DNA helicase PcrA [Bacillota bacterium]